MIKILEEVAKQRLAINNKNSPHSIIINFNEESY